MKNIIIFGPAGAGKTTVAKTVRDLCPGVIIASLGTKIKEICKELAYQRCSSLREMQQGVGQGMRGIFGDEVWCRYLWNEHWMKLGSGMATLVIDDGRQLSELLYWRRRGFIAIGINADPATRAVRLIDRDGYDQQHRFDHETEIAAENIAENYCQHYIRNEGTLLGLMEQVRTILEVEG